MHRLAPALLLLLLAAPLRADAPQTLSYADLVHHLTDMEVLAVLPPVGEKTALASSYDRASQYDAATDKYINWGANGDGFGSVRDEQNDTVMADIKGPGCIWRIWSAAADLGHVKIYLDGSTTPAIDLPFKTYFDHDHGPFPWKNLCYLMAAEPPAPNEPGSSLYVPIPFQKSCKITGDKQVGADPHTIWGGYYHFNYTTFPAGTVVPTFKLPFSDADKAALDDADHKLGQCGQDPAGSRPGEKTESKDLVLEAGAMTTAVDLSGPGAITALKIKVPLNQDLDEEKKILLRQLTIHISWDGEQKPSVWSPLGDFFATIGGAAPFATLPVGLQPDGTFYCYWYMPFGQSAKIELGNDGSDPVPVTVTTTHAPLDRPIGDFARFHAKWHRDQFQPTRSDRWPDWTFLTTQGRGRFVGMMLHAFVPVTSWWGEGDEKFFVDGEKFPSDFGTGTEDYFGYAWGAGNTFVRPFHAQPLNENNCNHVDDVRWHIAESVPFQTGFEGDLEKYFYNDPMSVSKYPGTDTAPKPTDPHALYAAEAYWYLAPGGTDPYEALPVADRTMYWTTWAKYNEPGVIEGEWLKGVAHPPSDGDFAHMPYPKPTLQDAPDVFSGNRELFWGTDHGPTSHEEMEVNIPVKKDGRYQVLVRFAKGPTGGILDVSFEDHDDAATVDCYAPTITAGDPVDIGTYDLAAGEHPLDFMLNGVNPANKEKGLSFGIDYVKLVPVASIEPAHFQATGADDSSIHSIRVGEVHALDASGGDTWDLAWTRQDTLYSPSNDTAGIHLGGNHNLMFNKITGDPAHLDGRTVNDMADYGNTGASMGDNCTWKSSGCMAIDGVLYWLIARHQYGGDQTVDYDKRQKAHGSSFIKSTDNGKTWSGSPQDHKDHPMFPGTRFATPYFVQYGQDGHEAWADGSDKYVYALSNNGFWDNGDYVILGRCLRSKMPALNGTDWQFYTTGDGTADSAWTSNVHDAMPVVCHPDHLGMTRAVYLPKHQCYLMIGWYYPAGGGKMETSDGLAQAAHVKTNWDFYVAPHPWGPWRVVGSHTWTPQGYYTPGICPKFNSADESTVWAFTAGDWTSPYYKLTAVQLIIKWSLTKKL
jgi:hypothetical protein